MKTFKIVVITVIATLLLETLGIAGFLVVNGCLGINKKEEVHKIETYVDGQLADSKHTSELFGYEINLNFNDGVYIGK